jgi:hypothetical protein
VTYKYELPDIYIGACEVALITPSSATSERIFAMYDTLFDDRARSALEDRRETSVMLRVNKNFRLKEQQAL